MRVVAGELRGRRLIAPRAEVTRPTTDKVREAVFNALLSRSSRSPATPADALVDARVADLYAGSGAMGIEALSRGAAHCTFVERDRRAVAVIEENVTALGLRDRSRIRGVDALAVAGTLDADLVFADPPYGFEDWTRLLVALAAGPAALVVAEAAAPVPAPEGWTSTREKRYGRTWVTFLEPTAR